MSNSRTKHVYDKWGKILQEQLGDLAIPINDIEAYTHFPEYRWMFNKLDLSHKQNIPAFPLGVEPSENRKQVFVKPIINLGGLSNGARVVDRNWEELEYQPGFMWMPYFQGPQLSGDLAVNNGLIEWAYFMQPEKDEYGSFKLWETAEYIPNSTYKVLIDWCGKYFSDYQGLVNVEMMGSKIIECVPRMASQFIDFYGATWLDSVIRLYTGKGWMYPGRRRTGVSYIARTRSLWQYPEIKDKAALEQIEKNWAYSIYLPWEKHGRWEPGDGLSHRVAIINSKSRESARIAKKMLYEHAITVR